MELLVCILPLIYSHPRPFSGSTLQWIHIVIAKMPAILSIVSTTSTYIGRGGVWRVVVEGSITNLNLVHLLWNIIQKLESSMLVEI